MVIAQVYMIQHNITERMYIGRSRDVPQRVNHHFIMLRAGKHSIEDMQSDYDNYGDDFTVSILGDVNNSNLQLEIDMMDKYKSTVRGVGYNYKDPHVTTAIRNANKERSIKQQLRNLIGKLSDSQATYAYTLLSKLFGEDHTYGFEIQD